MGDELRKLNTDIHDIISEFIDRKLSLVFIIYHLEAEEKLFFDERLPYILKNFMFPRWARKCNSGVWSFSSYPHFDCDGLPDYYGMGEYIIDTKL